MTVANVMRAGLFGPGCGGTGGIARCMWVIRLVPSHTTRCRATVALAKRLDHSGKLFAFVFLESLHRYKCRGRHGYRGYPGQMEDAPVGYAPRAGRASDLVRQQSVVAF